MYLADLLNSYGLFQRTSTWMKESDFADQIALLLNRATSCVVSIKRIEDAQLRCVQEYELFDDQVSDVDERIVFNSRSLVELQNEISPLLSSLRIMQDSVNALLGKKLKTSLPSSIADTIKNIDKYSIPLELKKTLLKYWETGGKNIRDYRVLDQHYVGLVDHVFLQLKPTKKILLLFPDEPTEQSRSKLSYDREVCGISVLRIGFDEIHELLEDVAEYFKYSPGKLQTVIGMKQLGDLTPFRKRTIGFLFEAPITENVDGKMQMNISGIRFGQLEDGRLQMQKMLLTKEKLEKINKNSAKK